MAASTLAAPAHPEPTALSRSTAVKFVVLLGVVSLFADMTYEGARSVTGPYLAVLGASGAAVGVVAGFGELVGYGLRLVSGYWADRTRRYWAITILGYALNMLAVPALALAGRWEVAAVLMVLERTGKALRNPPRDVMLSRATHEMGRGWGFGLHEAMYQTGALIGPLIVAAVLASRVEYSTGFAFLLVFLGGFTAALIGVALWGVGMGRARVGDARGGGGDGAGRPARRGLRDLQHRLRAGLVPGQRADGRPLRLGAAALGVAVLGPEGLAAGALAAADVLVPSIDDGLDLLLTPRRLVATLWR